MSTSELNLEELTKIPDKSHFISVPLCYQETEYTCGVACVQSLLARYGIVYRQSALAEIFHSQPIFGTDTESIVNFARLLGFQASVIDTMRTEDIPRYLAQGITPLLVIQAWRDDDIEYPFDWKDSHYIIACGCYEDGIIAMDPNILGNYAYLPNSELIKRWHYADHSGIHHNRTGLILEYENCPTPYRPSAVKYLR